MRIGTSFFFAIRTLKRNRFRSILTSSGILIGVASVVIVIGLGKSAKVSIKERINNFGPNSIIVTKMKKYEITEKDIEQLKKYNKEIDNATIYYYKKNVMMRYKSEKNESHVIGSNNDYFKIRKWALSGGRIFLDVEVQNSERVAVIGITVRQKLFGLTNPVGEAILVNDIPFRIIGTLEEKGASLKGSDFDNLIVLPYGTFKKRLFPLYGNPDLYITTKVETQVPAVGKIISRYLINKINPQDDEDGFIMELSTEKMEIAETISKVLTLLLVGIASISLIVGGIGIMNIMLVSVSERTREIGIRIAIGAKKRDILYQFLIEAVTLCIFSGIMGIGLGFLLYYLLVDYLSWQFFFSYNSIFISLSFACFTGIFFGFYPAKKAADLNPIDALRFE